MAVLWGTPGHAEGLQIPCLSNKPASARFTLPTTRVWPSVRGQPDICLWNDDRLAAVSITIDDDHAEDHAWWTERALETGFRFTWFVITGLVGSDGSTWAHVQNLGTAGHQIQSHTVSHLTNTNPPWPGIAWDYQASQTTIQARINGARASALAYPGGLSGANDRTAAAHYYLAARGTYGAPNKANQIDYFDVNSVGNGTGAGYVDPLLCGASSITWLNNTQYLRGWLNAHFHNMTPALRASTSNDLVNLAGRTNDLWIGLFDEIARYGQERDTAECTVLTNAERVVRFNLADQLLDTAFDVPLTTKIRLYESWTLPVALQEGRPIPLRMVITNDIHYALIQVVPDSGEVVLLDRYTDFDQDGLPDWAECLAGTDPDNRSDYPRLQSATAAGQLVLSWSSVTTRHYSVLAASNLTDGFAFVLLDHLPATPPLNTVTVNLFEAGSVFHQLRVE